MSVRMMLLWEATLSMDKENKLKAEQGILPGMMQLRIRVSSRARHAPVVAMQLSQAEYKAANEASHR